MFYDPSVDQWKSSAMAHGCAGAPESEPSADCLIARVTGLERVELLSRTPGAPAAENAPTAP
jgi:hypothetical protein